MIEGWCPTLLQMYLTDIQPVLDNEEEMHQVYPPREERFRAFEMSSVDDVKVCIIGQDPYHRKGEANGLCFSVSQGCKTPPSLRNIFKELERSYGVKRTITDLSDWGAQGVLLVNTALTVREGQPGSHAGLWKEFTKEAIKHLNQKRQGIVYMLWGAHAQSFKEFIDERNNLILTHSHPSPLSRKPFTGNQHFELCNAYLVERNMSPIKWL